MPFYNQDTKTYMYIPMPRADWSISIRRLRGFFLLKKTTVAYFPRTATKSYLRVNWISSTDTTSFPSLELNSIALALV